jgi:thiamine-phosphate pyrophosphorylase
LRESLSRSLGFVSGEHSDFEPSIVKKMLLYAITSRQLLPGDEPERQAVLLDLIRAWSAGGVDYIQIREKDLPAQDLLALARRIVAAAHEESAKTQILLNGPAEIALEAEADGIHLTGSMPFLATEATRRLYRAAGREAIISRACHSVEDVRAARDASLIVFAPVFEKIAEPGSPGRESAAGQGLDVLSEACLAAGPVPVFALGGVTLENAASCIAAGAAGVAGIRLFLGEEWRQLR